MTKIIDFSPENPNGVSRDMTPEEETLLAQDIANAKAFKKAQDDKETEKNILKASAKAKLIAGEPLTEEEADTIVL